MPFREPSVPAMMRQISFSPGKGRRSVRDRALDRLTRQLHVWLMYHSVHVYLVFGYPVLMVVLVLLLYYVVMYICRI